jgi:hypothetical protein
MSADRTEQHPGEAAATRQQGKSAPAATPIRTPAGWPSTTVDVTRTAVSTWLSLDPSIRWVASVP